MVGLGTSRILNWTVCSLLKAKLLSQGYNLLNLSTVQNQTQKLLQPPSHPTTSISTYIPLHTTFYIHIATELYLK